MNSGYGERSKGLAIPTLVDLYRTTDFGLVATKWYHKNNNHLARHMKSKMCWYALGHAVLLECYIALVMFSMPRLGAVLPKDNESMFGAMVFVTTFVFSAAVAATLVFGRPIMLYLNGEKKAAMHFLGATLGWLFSLLVLTVTGYLIFGR